MCDREGGEVGERGGVCDRGPPAAPPRPSIPVKTEY